MKKFLVLAALVVCLFSNVQAFAFGDDVAKEAIKAVADVAKAAINKDKTTVEVENSDIINDVEIEQGVSVGNSGISVKGNKVEIQNSTLKNDVKIEQGVSFGNSGIELGE